MLNPLECRLRAAECHAMAKRETSPRVRALLEEMESTWTRLALDAEQALKQRRQLRDVTERTLPQPHA
jgi:hypothetical protein